MMRFVFLFVDGIGLGEDNPETNLFAAAKMPNLASLLGGRRLINGAAPLETERATLLELDANLGVDGLPQSASGQACVGKIRRRDGISLRFAQGGAYSATAE